MLEGHMLEPEEEGYVVIGKNLLAQYTLGASAISESTLKGVSEGSRIRIVREGETFEFVVKGVIESKVSDISTRVFLSDTEARRIFGRTDKNISEIAVRLRDPADAVKVRDALISIGTGRFARIETARESQGTFLDDIERTFVILSNVIGAVGLAVASITVFIVIFINAITRRKYIGILKGIGISGTAIELSYVFQSLFYAVIGSAIGLIFVFFVIAPYFELHPINFPFADGVLLAPIFDTLSKAALLILITIIAGYLPARIIVSRNTLDAILGR
jgi:putative ABC transport system permease protein